MKLHLKVSGLTLLIYTGAIMARSYNDTNFAFWLVHVPTILLLMRVCYLALNTPDND